jgi:hypothetical protein
MPGTACGSSAGPKAKKARIEPPTIASRGTSPTDCPSPYAWVAVSSQET